MRRRSQFTTGFDNGRKSHAAGIESSDAGGQRSGVKPGILSAVTGMRLHASWDSGAYLSCGALWLCLSLDEQRRKTPPQESDYTHYAFSVAEEEFAGVVALLAQAGAEVWKDNRSEGASYYFLDPDGHKLELHVGIWRSGWPPVANAPTRGWSF